jgi:hypothetical protein
MRIGVPHRVGDRLGDEQADVIDLRPGRAVALGQRSELLAGERHHLGIGLIGSVKLLLCGRRHAAGCRVRGSSGCLVPDRVHTTVVTEIRIAKPPRV